MTGNVETKVHLEETNFAVRGNISDLDTISDQILLCARAVGGTPNVLATLEWREIY